MEKLPSVIYAVVSVGKFKKKQMEHLEAVRVLPGFITAHFSVEQIGTVYGEMKFHDLNVIFDPALTTVRKVKAAKLPRFSFRTVKRVTGFVP